MATEKNTEEVEETTVENAADGSVETVETTTEVAADAVAEAPKKKASAKPKKAKADDAESKAEGESTADKKEHKRAEKVGVVWSDKMEKTVVVRVDRLVKHPLYHKYIKRRKKFMAHNEVGAAAGDKVRIVETRPLSARKRWRVVEIIQKAVK